MSDEEAGRKVRYDFFNEVAGADGKIATAHNKNDNAETVMMRFMRGTGLHGLTGIPYKRNNIIRPLLDISRAEIEEYLTEINQSHITDETNLKPIYTRNKIRLNLIPEIQKEFNPNFIETLSNNIVTYADEDDYMTQQANKAVQKYFEIKQNELRVCKNVIQEEHIAIVKRAIKMAFTKAFNIELSSQSINNIVSIFNKPNGTKMTVIGEIVASVQYSGIVIQHDIQNKDLYEFQIDADLNGLSGCLNTNNMVIWYGVVNAENVVNNATTFYYPLHLCQNGFTLRTRRDGDIIIIAPGVRKKLKKFFIDEKIDAAKRDDYWLLVNENNEVVWIPQLFGSRLKADDRNGEFVKFVVIGK
jgi:tRNA(Ile)-lysidine synthase